MEKKEKEFKSGRILSSVSMFICYVTKIYGTKYSRMDQIKFVEDSI